MPIGDVSMDLLHKFWYSTVIPLRSVYCYGSNPFHMLQKCKLKLNLPSLTYKLSPNWCVQPSILTLLYVNKLTPYLVCVCLTVSW